MKLHPVKVGIPLHGDAIEWERVFSQLRNRLIGVKPYVFVELSKLSARSGQDSNVPQ